mmetsp:Transcript_9446/g.28529  ORF Transcript_9446/g.28529 Transcript_9446/m.28529 type:complete len:271 (+) Transcript_9446:241-1053(+)
MFCLALLCKFPFLCQKQIRNGCRTSCYRVLCSCIRLRLLLKGLHLTRSYLVRNSGLHLFINIHRWRRWCRWGLDDLHIYYSCKHQSARQTTHEVPPPRYLPNKLEEHGNEREHEQAHDEVPLHLHDGRLDDVVDVRARIKHAERHWTERLRKDVIFMLIRAPAHLSKPALLLMYLVLRHKLNGKLNACLDERIVGVLCRNRLLLLQYGLVGHHRLLKQLHQLKICNCAQFVDSRNVGRVENLNLHSWLEVCIRQFTVPSNTFVKRTSSVT